jgi:hypothetical protein
MSTVELMESKIYVMFGESGECSDMELWILGHRNVLQT